MDLTLKCYVDSGSKTSMEMSTSLDGMEQVEEGMGNAETGLPFGVAPVLRRRLEYSSILD